MIDNRIDLPISSAEALIKYKDEFLNEYEENEITEFTTIYFLSYKDNKIKPTKVERLVNNGFDDTDGYYKIVVSD
jgi:hypothetical protein